jgi:hypothetical protein
MILYWKYYEEPREPLGRVSTSGTAFQWQPRRVTKKIATGDNQEYLGSTEKVDG